MIIQERILLLKKFSYLLGFLMLSKVFSNVQKLTILLSCGPGHVSSYFIIYFEVRLDLVSEAHTLAFKPLTRRIDVLFSMSAVMVSFDLTFVKFECFIQCQRAFSFFTIPFGRVTYFTARNGQNSYESK